MRLPVRGAVDIVLVDDRTIARLAGRFRGSPRATDVLAFGYVDGAPAGTPAKGFVAGEVAISVDTARRQARERGAPLVHELVLLCVHGLLHLGGQDDESPAEWCAMKRAEFETMMAIL